MGKVKLARRVEGGTDKSKGLIGEQVGRFMI
jgi:hypothetical protein